VSQAHPRRRTAPSTWAVRKNIGLTVVYSQARPLGVFGPLGHFAPLGASSPWALSASGRFGPWALWPLAALAPGCFGRFCPLALLPLGTFAPGRFGPWPLWPLAAFAPALATLAPGRFSPWLLYALWPLLGALAPGLFGPWSHWPLAALAPGRYCPWALWPLAALAPGPLAALASGRFGPWRLEVGIQTILIPLSEKYLPAPLNELAIPAIASSVLNMPSLLESMASKSSAHSGRNDHKKRENKLKKNRGKKSPEKSIFVAKNSFANNYDAQTQKLSTFCYLHRKMQVIGLLMNPSMLPFVKYNEIWYFLGAQFWGRHDMGPGFWG
jgi:hypothetical protein